MTARKTARNVLVVSLVLAATALGHTAPAATGAPPKRERALRRFERREAELRGRSASDRLLPRFRHSLTADSEQTFAAENFRLLADAPVAGEDDTADVWFFDHGGRVGKHAYLGNRCEGSGVKIFNVNDPRNPRQVAVVGRRNGVSNEDIVVRRIGGRDILGVGVQACEPGAQNGLRLFDVTTPSRPSRLAFLPMPGGVHELDMVVRNDGIALALLAVPFVEFENTYFGADAGGEFRIVDISDPSSPVELADWGIIADSSLRIPGGNDEISSTFQGLGYFASVFAHGARAGDAGMSAYLSYWDAGVLKFDISDPSNPTLLAYTKYPQEPDGDAHSLVTYDLGGRRFILQNDEDFEALAPTIVKSSATGDTRYSGIEEPWVPTRLSDGPGLVTGTIHDAGDGCDVTDFTGARDKIVLADTVDPFYVGIIDGWSLPCGIGRQVLLAARAGAKGLLSNLISPDDAWPFQPGSQKSLEAIQTRAVGMTVVQISDIDELASAIRLALSQRDVTVTLRARIPSWGYLRVFDESSATDRDRDGVQEYHQVGSFSDLIHVRGEPTSPPGAWSIHNTEVSGNRGYSSWYSHGIVALDLSNPRAPRRVGQFVPPSSFVWGVAIDSETGIVYASDIGSGLWIVKPTGAATPG